ncbi:MAG TPA: MATE family efflux transporter [Kofleriaceae bacterium]|nr:MATE family efflux transporter [Kofleriaceae bacterium]
MRSPFRTLLALALPMMAARASQSVITFADAVQVKHLGTGAIASVATGGLNVVGVYVLPMSTVFIVQSFVAQLVGRGDRAETRRFAWYGLAIAAIAGLFGAALIPAVEPVLAHLDYSPAVRHDMADYMQIRMLSVAAIVGVEALGNWYGGLGNTRMQMIAGLVTMVAAVFCNWLLIDGHLGAPAMGVRGAALASTIASWLGLAYLAIAFWRGWGGAERRRTPLALRELGRVVRFGLPNGFNWFFEFAAFQLFVNIVVAGLGDTTVAALNVVLAVNAIGFMPAFGLASAGAIVAGHAIGAGDRDAVWPQVKLTLACTIGWMCALGAVYVLAPGALLELFRPEHAGEGLVAVGTSMLWISALWQVFDASSMTFSETLRAAGDTAWVAGARIVLAWLVFTPTAYLLVRRWHGGATGAMACLVGYLALLASVLALRFRSGRWRKIELIEPKLV